MKLLDYVAAERGRGAKVATAAGLPPAFISQIAHGQRKAPALRCPAIVAACGGEVQLWDLRPDDWWCIWPMLVGTEGAPPIPQPETAAVADAEVRDAA